MMTRFYSKHWRLLALIALSALLHLAAITMIPYRPAALPLGEPLAPLTVTLLAGAAPARVPAEPPAAIESAAVAEKPGAALPAIVPAGAVLPGQAPADIAGESPGQMPGQYRVRPPPPVSLHYQVSQAAPGQAPSPTDTAELRWSNSGDGAYSLRLSTRFFGTVLDSKGVVDDAGIAPDLAAELRGGRQLETEFDRTAGRIRFGASGKDGPITPGSQDRLSLLIQLAGIGLAEPDQIQGRLEFYVAGPDGAGIVRLDVVGKEVVVGPLGKLPAWHLAEPAAPGAARLEVWLAPSHSWLPVKVRTTVAGGATSTLLATAVKH